MTLRKLSILAFLGIFSMSITSLSAQTRSSLKKSTNKESEKGQTDSKKEDESAKEEEKTWTYVIMTLSGQEGNYSAQMEMAKTTDLTLQPDESLAVQKKANSVVSRNRFGTETDFLLEMIGLDLELVSVVNENMKNQVAKKYYFKKEVVLKEEE